MDYSWSLYTYMVHSRCIFVTAHECFSVFYVSLVVCLVGNVRVLCSVESPHLKTQRSERVSAKNLPICEVTNLSLFVPKYSFSNNQAGLRLAQLVGTIPVCPARSLLLSICASPFCTFLRWILCGAVCDYHYLDGVASPSHVRYRCGTPRSVWSCVRHVVWNRSPLR